MENKTPSLGKKVRAIRKRHGISLADLSDNTGLSKSTLYKVEGNRMSLTYENLIKLSHGLGIDISELFSSSESGPKSQTNQSRHFPGRRVIGKGAPGTSVETDNYIDTYLCAELSFKSFDPVLTRVKARSLEEFGDFSRHQGEEFTYVLSGKIEVYSEAYEPVLLNPGDYIFFDSLMGHAYINANTDGQEDPLILTICAGNDNETTDIIKK